MPLCCNMIRNIAVRPDIIYILCGALMGAQAAGEVHRSRGGHYDIYHWGPEVRRRDPSRARIPPPARQEGRLNVRSTPLISRPTFRRGRSPRADLQIC
jgi:hypothetical protein